jgi:hypothetical protein
MKNIHKYFTHMFIAILLMFPKLALLIFALLMWIKLS